MPHKVQKHFMTTLSFRISPASWQTDHEVLTQLRFAVFVREQGVPPEIEIDPRDADEAQIVHIVARDAEGNAIGTARLVLDSATPRIGRMAVVRIWRKHGVGRALLNFLCDYAKERGYKEVRLNSQTHATAFYYKQGFLSHGEEFIEAGIPHLEMRRAL
jgi:predicted GNAT family N-acyltransferase